MIMMKISVIIPIYNVERYIEKCLNSFLHQGLDDIELICVDDGSTDASGEIVDDYARRYSNIVVVHQKNQGVAAARNKGISLAVGDYIAWCDPDDYVDIDWKKEIIKAINYDPDCIVIRLMKCKGNKKKAQKQYEKGWLNKSDYIYELSRDRYIKSYLCTHIIKRQILLKHHFDSKIKYYEDYDFFTRFCVDVEKIYFVDKILYYYIFRVNSLTNKLKPIKYILQSMRIASARYAGLKKIGYRVSKEGCFKTYILSYGELTLYKRKYGLDKIILGKLCKNFSNIMTDTDVSLKTKIANLMILLMPYFILKCCWEWIKRNG